MQLLYYTYYYNNFEFFFQFFLPILLFLFIIFILLRSMSLLSWWHITAPLQNHSTIHHHHQNSDFFFLTAIVHVVAIVHLMVVEPAFASTCNSYMFCTYYNSFYYNGFWTYSVAYSQSSFLIPLYTVLAHVTDPMVKYNWSINSFTKTMLQFFQGSDNPW